FDHVGAGLVTKPGGPGVASVLKLRVSPGVRVVTATLPPMKGKRETILSQAFRRKVNGLGERALDDAISDHTFDGMLAAGRAFADGLGLETPSLKRLIKASMESGAMASSQNMVGDSIHAIVPKEGVERVVQTLRSVSDVARVDVFRIGGKSARTIIRKSTKID
ncbi:MAG: hypothetical protein OK454_12325, partial [Thaumarchaeota archaeon]|nr:hypothetical protein [Nitrososphaerota archaeon]